MNKFIDKYIDNKFYVIGAGTIIILVVFIFIPYLLTHFSFGYSLDEKASNIGEAIGGIAGTVIAFIGIFLTFLAFYIQYKANQIQIENFKLQKTANEQQNINFQFQQIESNLFNLLALHRQNIDEMEIKNKKQRVVFVILRAEFQDIYEIVKKNYSKIDKMNHHKGNIAFVFFYFGIGETTSPTIKNILYPHYSKEVINAIESDIVTAQKEGYKKQKYLGKFNIEANNKPYFPFNGHQGRLSHYFAHFYEIVRHIEKQNVLSDSNKKDYIEALRAQCSVHELAIFFYCSISAIGRIWREQKYLSDKTEKPCNLITKYEIIKTLPSKQFTYELDPSVFYPDLKFSWQDYSLGIEN